MQNQSGATTTVEFYQNKLTGFRAELYGTDDKPKPDAKRCRYLKRQIEIIEAKMSSMFPMKTF